MTHKRNLAECTIQGDVSVSCSLKGGDLEAFLVDRNFLSRFVYKNTNQYRRIDVLNRVAQAVKMIDKYLDGAEEASSVINRCKYAAERFFQQIGMGLNIPYSLAVVAGLARICDILQTQVMRKSECCLNTSLGNSGMFDNDLGEEVER